MTPHTVSVIQEYLQCNEVQEVVEGIVWLPQSPDFNIIYCNKLLRNFLQLHDVLVCLCVYVCICSRQTAEMCISWELTTRGIRTLRSCLSICCWHIPRSRVLLTRRAPAVTWETKRNTAVFNELYNTVQHAWSCFDNRHILRLSCLSKLVQKKNKWWMQRKQEIKILNFNKSGYNF